MSCCLLVISFWLIINNTVLRFWCLCSKQNWTINSSKGSPAPHFMFSGVVLKTERSIYGLFIKSAPFFGDFKNFPGTKNNSRFYILNLYFLLHYNQFSCNVTSLLNIALRSWCILFKIRKIHVFGQIGAFICLVSIERGRGQDKYFHR